MGCKEDGGGCHRASGWVGKTVVHRAVHNRDAAGALASLLTLSTLAPQVLYGWAAIQTEQPHMQDPLCCLYKSCTVCGTVKQVGAKVHSY